LGCRADRFDSSRRRLQGDESSGLPRVPSDALHLAPCLLLLAFVWATGALAQEPTPSTNAVRFHAVKVFIDSHDQPLAAYQIDLKSPPGTRIVGIEGGVSPAFSEPPHYDPRAIQSERVILGAFSTLPQQQLPKGRTRVATIHLQSERDAVPEFEVQAATAANAKGGKVEIQTTVEESKGESK